MAGIGAAAGVLGLSARASGLARAPAGVARVCRPKSRALRPVAAGAAAAPQAPGAGLPKDTFWIVDDADGVSHVCGTVDGPTIIDCAPIDVDDDDFCRSFEDEHGAPFVDCGRLSTDHLGEPPSNLPWSAPDRGTHQ